MKYALGNMLNGAGGLNADQLALDLQFAADKTLTARKGPTPVFTRASSGTFVGSNGLIQSAGNNVARFDHDPVTLASRGLLIEESRTNVALYSGDLVNGTGWVTTNASSIVDGVGPNNSAAYQVSETTASGIHFIANTGGLTGAAATSVVTGTVYTGSIFLKKVTGSIDWVQITLNSVGFGTGQYANFNIGNGTVGNSAGLASGTSPRIENYGNGWYRCSISAAATSTVTNSSNVVIGFIQNTNGTTRLPSYAGSTSNQVLAAMCQFEVGSFPTSYIPTTTASVVRSADVCSISGAGFTGMWNTAEGTLFASGDKTTSTAASGSYFSLQAGATEVGPLMTRSSTALIGRIRNSTGTDLTNTDTSQSPAGEKKVAVTWKATSDAADRDYASGGVILVKSNPSAGTAASNQTTLIIGGRPSTSWFNGTISSIRYYRKRLANQKLVTLTT